MKILAVDPGSNELGLYDGERAVTLSVSKKYMKRPERLAELGQKLVDFIHEHGPYDFIVYEEQFSRGDGATRALYGMVGIIECSAVNSGAGVMGVPQSKLRKWAHDVAQCNVMAFYTSLKPANRGAWKCLFRDLARFNTPSRIDLKTQDEHDAACIYYFFEQKGLVD